MTRSVYRLKSDVLALRRDAAYAKNEFQHLVWVQAQVSAAGVVDRRGGHDIRPTVVDEDAVAAVIERISARMEEISKAGSGDWPAAVDAEIVWLLDQAGWTQA